MSQRAKISQRDYQLLLAAQEMSYRLDTPNEIPFSLLRQLFGEFMYCRPDGAIIYLIRNGFLSFLNQERQRVQIESFKKLSTTPRYGPEPNLPVRSANLVLEHWAKAHKVTLRRKVTLERRPAEIVNPVAKRKSISRDRIMGSVLKGVRLDQILADHIHAEILFNNSLPEHFTLTIVSHHCFGGQDPVTVYAAMKQVKLLKMWRDKSKAKVCKSSAAGRTRCRKSKKTCSFTSAEKTQIVRGLFW